MERKFSLAPGENPEIEERINQANKKIAESASERARAETGRGLSSMAKNPGETDKVREEMKKVGVKFHPAPNAKRPRPDDRIGA